MGGARADQRAHRARCFARARSARGTSGAAIRRVNSSTVLATEAGDAWVDLGVTLGLKNTSVRCVFGDARCQVRRSYFSLDKFSLDKLVFLCAPWAVGCDPNLVK